MWERSAHVYVALVFLHIRGLFRPREEDGTDASALPWWDLLTAENSFVLQLVVVVADALQEKRDIARTRAAGTIGRTHARTNAAISDDSPEGQAYISAA